VDELAQHTARLLFARIAEGDESAYREVFHAYNKILFPFIAALVKSETDAREIMQETFLKLWVNRSKLTEVENPGGWLHTVASHAAYDHLRKLATYELMLKKSQAGLPDTAADFLVSIDARQTRQVLEEGIRQLPLKRRQIFRLSRIEGFSRKEIAEQMGISENTVRNQLAEAMDFIQDYMQKHNGALLVPVSVLLITFY
jgi:RNA polymerase sigma-70 factor (ECF subfamily)